MISSFVDVAVCTLHELVKMKVTVLTVKSSRLWWLFLHYSLYGNRKDWVWRWRPFGLDMGNNFLTKWYYCVCFALILLHRKTDDNPDLGICYALQKMISIFISDSHWLLLSVVLAVHTIWFISKNIKHTWKISEHLHSCHSWAVSTK